MKKLKLGIIGLSFLLITACGPIMETHYSYVPPKSQAGKACTFQCQQTQTYCERLAQSNYDNCIRAARDDANNQFNQYVYNQRARGLPIRHGVDYYYNPFACSRDNSDCKNKYNACYQSCGGQVIAEQRCTAFCK